ncbi:acyl-CoA thioesterase [Actinokineospora inagensis]|uniref:acyl-CoA thioesterase n=1 Tax=Actinokineospora inagensis TaxID=103730 RepID=UPI00040F2EB0|nr:hotdog domain-containing protein [Actinokineospora inagensis]
MTEAIVHSGAPDSAKQGTFRYTSHVFFDELDAMGFLHNTRYAVHVERATARFFEGNGFFWEASIENNPDKFHVVRRFEVDLAAPYAGSGPLDVDLWLDHLGTTSLRYGFRCLGPQGQLHASGLRAVVKLNAETFRPEPWTDRWRATHLSLLGPARST